MMKAMIFDVERGSYVDGPGVRTTVFMKGCNLDCAWCHNPESQSYAAQRLWYAGKCTHCGKCAVKCPSGAISPSIAYDISKCTLCGKCAIICPNNATSICGHSAEIPEIMNIIRKDKDIYSSTGGGVTLSGGECMLNTEFTAELLRCCRDEHIHTAVDTAGNVPFADFERIMPYTDLFLYDIKAVTPELHKQFTGADNSLILDNYKRLLSLGANIIVRVPMICEVNANGFEFPKIAGFLNANPPLSVELLPYHAMGENKFRALYQTEPPRFTAPSENEMNEYRKLITKGIL